MAVKSKNTASTGGGKLRAGQKPVISGRHMRTSIGKSVNTRITNKHKRKGFKKYRGQGKT